MIWLLLLITQYHICHTSPLSTNPISSPLLFFVDDRYLKPITTHVNDTENILKSIKYDRNNRLISLKRSISNSHCPRPQNYKKDFKTLQIDVSGFNKILDIQYIENYYINDKKIDAYVDVESMMSFEDLVNALEPIGLMPAVVPEFKGITVGGSLQGLAAESTSLHYGFVHNIIQEYDVILGNGEKIHCSRLVNKDLFESLPGSYGTLGICTRVRIGCIKCEPFIKVKATCFSNNEKCVNHLMSLQNKALIKQRNEVNFVEGIVYDNDKYVSIEGTFINEVDAIIDEKYNNITLKHCNQIGHKWFFNQISDLFPKKSLFSKIFNSKLRQEDNNEAEIIQKYVIYPTKDYLFRHDRGSFWMASYRIPQIIGSWMGSLLDSTSMFQLATALPWVFPKKVIVLQDFMIPRKNLIHFIKELQAALGKLYPLWLLPMRNVDNENSIFTIPSSPPTVIPKSEIISNTMSNNADDIIVYYNDKENIHFINCGVYGIPSKSSYDFIKDNIKLESILTKYHGRKVFYSHAFYSRAQFYNELYDGKKYFLLRDKYHATDVFPEVYDKVITKNGKL